MIKAVTIGRSTLSPSKTSGTSARMSSDRRSEPPQLRTKAPAVARPPFQMVRDSGTKTAREREFNAKIGTPGGPQFRTVYERSDAQKDGTPNKTGYKAKKAQ